MDDEGRRSNISPTTEYFSLAAGEDCDDFDGGSGGAPLGGVPCIDVTALEPPPSSSSSCCSGPFALMAWAVAVAALAILWNVHTSTRAEVEVLKQQLRMLEVKSSHQETLRSTASEVIGPAPRQATDYEELMCITPPNEEWANVKSEIGRQLGSWSGGTVAKKGEQLLVLLDGAFEQLQAAQGLGDACGLGRLCMSLLAVLTGDVGASLKNAPALHAPLLGVLLDVPWIMLVQSGWPLFGLLAQLHLHGHGNDDLPTEVDPRQAGYFKSLRNALHSGNPDRLAKLGADFLGKTGGDGDEAGSHAMPILCALASQLLGNDMHDGEEAREALKHVQRFFRQSVQSIDDLHASVISAWPLYGVLHAAAARLSSTAFAIRAAVDPVVSESARSSTASR